MDPSLAVAAAAVLSRLVHSHLDADEPDEARRARDERVAAAAVVAARTRYELAMLLAYGELDTHYARNVVEGHCDRMPRGQRCDDGRARGPWSVHPWCRAAYAYPAGSDASLVEEARCAVRQMSYGARHCRAHALTPMHGAFAALAAAPCGWAGADRRVRRALEVDRMLAAAFVPEP